MSPVTISLGLMNAVLVRKNLEDLNAEIPKIAEGRIWGRMEGARRRLGNYPSRYSGDPVHKWASDRQRRFVMAAIRDGTIQVPYQRTMSYADNWKIQKISGSLIVGYSLTNDLPYAMFVGGNSEGGRQYHLHQGRWPLAYKVLEDSAKDLPAEIGDHITTAARRRGF